MASTTPRHDRSRRARPVALAVVLWLFGLSTTVLLVGAWGRAVSVDETTLTDSALAILESGYVNERILGWLDTGSDGLATTGTTTATALDAALGDPVVRRHVDSMVTDLVAAAITPPGSTDPVDLSSAVAGLVGPLATALAEQGVTIDAAALESAVVTSGIVLDDDGRAAVDGAAARARTFLTRAVLVAAGAMVATGSFAIGLADDRLRQARALAIRLAVSAVTFTIMLRVGAWAVDPRGGRSALGQGGSIILGSNTHVVLGWGAAAVVAALLVTWRLARRPRARLTDGEPTIELPMATVGSTGSW